MMIFRMGGPFFSEFDFPAAEAGQKTPMKTASKGGVILHCNENNGLID